MKKLLLISMLAGALPLALMAQDDDLYFMPAKKTVAEASTDRYGMPKDTYYCGSDRSVDEYNRRLESKVEVLDSISTDTTAIDDDYKLTKRMSRFDDYRLSDNAAFWAGYQAGRYDWGWHSPWYYSRWGWYGSWYDPWYDPWYYGSWRWGWYDPWYYGYAGWYDPWYYGWGWGYPYYHYPRYVVIGGGGGRHHSGYIGTGTLRRDGSTSHYRGSMRGSVSGNYSRMSSLRDRARQMGGSYSSGRSTRSYSGSSSAPTRSRSTVIGNHSSSNSSFGGSTRSSGGFSGGSRGGGGSFGGGHSGGGGRSGGGGLGGRR